MHAPVPVLEMDDLGLPNQNTEPDPEGPNHSFVFFHTVTDYHLDNPVFPARSSSEGQRSGYDQPEVTVQNETGRQEELRRTSRLTAGHHSNPHHLPRPSRPLETEL